MSILFVIAVFIFNDGIKGLCCEIKQLFISPLLTILLFFGLSLILLFGKIRYDIWREIKGDLEKFILNFVLFVNKYIRLLI